MQHQHHHHHQTGNHINHRANDHNATAPSLTSSEVQMTGSYQHGLGASEQTGMQVTAYSAAATVGNGFGDDPAVGTLAHQYAAHNPFASCQYSGYGQG